MNVRQVLEEPLIIHGLPDRDDRVKQALEEVRLAPAEEFMSKFPHMLSGGQRQRVGIARALILQPDYILADEPVSMIDASSRTEILYLMRELQKRMGIAFLYITQRHCHGALLFGTHRRHVLGQGCRAGTAGAGAR